MNFPPFANITEKSLQDIGNEMPEIGNLYQECQYYYHSINIPDKKIKNQIMGSLSNFKFLVYEISAPKPKESHIKSENENITPNQTAILKFCGEESLFIIENIDLELASNIINNLDSKHIKLINFSNQQIGTLKITDDDKEARLEAQNIYSHYQKKIKNNCFVSNTLLILAGYLVRRFYCPTSFFNNPKFFSYDDNIEKSLISEFKKTFSDIIKTKYKSDYNYQQFLLKSSYESIKAKKALDYTNQKKTNLYKFQEEDFIILRSICLNGHVNIQLAFNITKKYIFAI
ncbi:hypothetical protein M9Y10_021285 [Tritrichomonas musculus]|uniref:Uncharacterized protein n=1 Tax=Tritrichomonas musculus TaxID=1915356 RepID=A0ABR2HFU9_9EUKA